ncbi:MAG: hypothetical protein OIF32_02670, partial [Campylobacterales bacterium]|nr:hypothetical protein [Campylobacterales bacterium]
PEPLGRVSVVNSLSYNALLAQKEPSKVLIEAKEVISSDSHDVSKGNLLMSVAKQGYIQTGEGALKKLSITKKEDELFSYIDEANITTPTCIFFIGEMEDSELCIGAYTSEDNVIDTTNTYIRRLGIWN